MLEAVSLKSGTIEKTKIAVISAQDFSGVPSQYNKTRKTSKIFNVENKEAESHYLEMI